MGYQLTVSTLIERCKQRSDKESDPHISDNEWKALISEQYGELYQLVAATGMRHFETSESITADGSASYSLPSDHLSTVAVRLVVNAAGERRDLQEIMQQETSMWSGMTGEARAYALSGDTLVLYPKPTSGTYEHIYVAQTPLAASAGTNTLVELVNIDGLSFLVWGVTVKALAKSQQDVTLAISEREAARMRLVEWATLRALNAPRRRVDPELADAYPDPAEWRFR